MAATIIEDPDYWINLWIESLSNNPLRANSFRSADMWDRLAENYKRNEIRDDKSLANETHLIEWLVNKKIVFRGTEILDIGCGPGNFAIPFAAHGANVVAMDISPNMIKRLERETPQKLRNNIRTVVADWRDLDLKKKKFFQRFDLVFAHMTPAVNTPNQFLKIMDASKNWCFNATWIGKRTSEPLDELTEIIYEKANGHRSRYFIFALNLLISMGYLPRTDFRPTSWEKKEPLADVIDYYTGYFIDDPQYNTTEIIEKISAFLKNRSSDGMIIKKNAGTIGRMAWQVKV